MSVGTMPGLLGVPSFGALLRRAEAALTGLAALPSPSLAYVFSHGQFIQAVRAIVTQGEMDDRGKMLNFWRKGEPPAISNAELVQLAWQAEGWQHQTTHAAT